MASFAATELTDAFPASTLLSETVGLVEKVLGEFPWPRLGKTSNSIRVMVPSGPAVHECRTGAGWGTRTGSSTVQGFKTWFSSSMQPNRVLQKVFHGELPARPKELGAEQKSPTAGRSFWGAYLSHEHLQPPVPSLLPAHTDPCSDRSLPTLLGTFSLHGGFPSVQGSLQPLAAPRCHIALFAHEK